LISDILPKNKDEKTSMSNSDPITGQAAWYDLKVKLYKCNKNEIDGNIYPNFDTIKNKARKNSDLNVYGSQFTKEYGKNTITDIQEFIGNSRNIK
jgi:hypothetical protein